METCRMKRGHLESDNVEDEPKKSKKATRVRYRRASRTDQAGRRKEGTTKLIGLGVIASVLIKHQRWEAKITSC